MMRKYWLFILLMMCPIVLAQDDNENLAVITGGLDWSADGQHIAVATSQGVYIHETNDLSVVDIIDEDLSIHTVDWSHEGYRLAYDDREGVAAIIYDFETGKRHHMTFDGVNSHLLYSGSIRWSPDDTMLAIGAYLVFETTFQRLILVDVDEETTIAAIPVEDYTGGTPDIQPDWSPDGQYLFAAKGDDYALIWDVAQQQPAYIWEYAPLPPGKKVNYTTLAYTMRWDHTQTRLAGGWDQKMYVANAETGEILHTFIKPGYQFYGLSWHPQEDWLAFFGQNFLQGVGRDQDVVVIWNLATDEVVELPGVVLIDVLDTQNVVQWSPDGSKLASISSDGRVIIWETENYEVIAEYDGYRSLIPEWAD